MHISIWYVKILLAIYANRTTCTIQSRKYKYTCIIAAKIAYITCWQSCSSCNCCWVGEISNPCAGRLKSSRRSCKYLFQNLALIKSRILLQDDNHYKFYLLAKVSSLFFVLSCSSKQASLVYLIMDYQKLIILTQLYLALQITPPK